MRQIPFLSALALALLAAPAAEAAFPGDNGRIAFTRDAGVNEEIWTAQPDGSDPRAITQNAWGDRMPAFSPDGAKIAFVSLENATSNPEIYVMDADGTDRVRLTNSAGNDFDPAWSPDGKKIAFMSTRVLGNPDIWVMDANGGNPVQLTNSSFDDLDPAWSPDGSTIAFVTTRAAPGSDIWAMTATGEDEHPLTTTDANEDPSWSADGTMLAFARDTGDADIYTMNANGTGAVNRSATPGTDLMPAFSPDGKRIAFTTTRHGQFEIATMAADGSARSASRRPGPRAAGRRTGSPSRRARSPSRPRPRARPRRPRRSPTRAAAGGSGVR